MTIAAERGEVPFESVLDQSYRSAVARAYLDGDTLSASEQATLIYRHVAEDILPLLDPLVRDGAGVPLLAYWLRDEVSERLAQSRRLERYTGYLRLGDCEDEVRRVLRGGYVLR